MSTLNFLLAIQPEQCYKKEKQLCCNLYGKAWYFFMKTIRFSIWEDGEYTWPQGYGFVPFLTGYLHEDNKERPCVLVVPGGAYYIASPTEAGIVALDFYHKGYQTFVLTYTTNLLGTIPLKDQPMRDLARAVRIVRSRSNEYSIKPDCIATCGFSAGGHLTASEGVHYNDIEEKNPLYSNVSARPDAMLLCYPVITSGPYTHEGSMQNLLGANPTADELKYMSLETQVTSQTPPSFLWQTVTDEVVPVENSYLFADACKKNGVSFAHHVFSQGPHGLSLATASWAQGIFGELYTLDPFKYTIDAIKAGTSNVDVSKEKLADLEREFPNHMPGNPCSREPNAEVSIWPCLADAWLRTQWPL